MVNWVKVLTVIVGVLLVPIFFMAIMLNMVVFNSIAPEEYYIFFCCANWGIALVLYAIFLFSFYKGVQIIVNWCKK